MEPVHSDLNKVESGASGQYLEINSAALAPPGSKQGSKVNKFRVILN